MDEPGDGVPGEEVFHGEVLDCFGAGVVFAADFPGVGGKDAAGPGSAVFSGRDEPEVDEPAVGFVVVDVVDFEGVVQREGEDAVGCDPDGAVFEDGGFHAVDEDGGDEVAAPGFAERDRLAGDAAVDGAGGDVVVPFTGCVFLPGEVVAGVDLGGFHGCAPRGCSVR